MKKKIVTLTLALVLVAALFASCSSNEKNNKFYSYDLDKYVKLGDYMSVDFKLESDVVTDLDVENKIKSLLKEKNLTTEVESTQPIANGDTAIIDFVGYINGETFQGGSAEAYSLEIGSNSFIEGFESGLVGKKIGDKTSLDLRFPETYHKKDFAGKPVVFEVTVKNIYRTVYPELTPDLLKKITAEPTLEAYKNSIREELTIEKKEAVKDNNYNNLVDLVLKVCEVKKYPKNEVMLYRDRYIQNYTQIANQQGLSIETFAAYNGLSMEDFKKQMEENAKQMVKKELVLLAIAEKEEITLTEKEYDEGMVRYMNELEYTSHKSFIEDIGENRLRGLLTIDKTVDVLMEKLTKK